MSGLCILSILSSVGYVLCAQEVLPPKPGIINEILQEIPITVKTEDSIDTLPELDSCPALDGIPADTTADVLREAIRALHAASTFTLPDFDAHTLEGNPVETKLLSAFGKDNYIQLRNPGQEAIYRSLQQLVRANPELDDPCILRFYLARRGEDAAATPSVTPPTTPVKTPTKTPIEPPTGIPGGTSVTTPPAARPAAPLDLKPINDANSKMSAALSRLRNAKGVKVTVEQRKELKKEADKLFKENNLRLKEAAQRFERIINQPGLTAAPDKLAPFKRFVETYRALEREIARI